MAKTCGKCKWYGELGADFGDTWLRWCRAPVPMVVKQEGSRETDPYNNAKDCEAYKKRKEK